jgi:hypothetical protein
MRLRWAGFLFLFLAAGAAGLFGSPTPERTDVVVLISANVEWKPVRAYLSKETAAGTPFGECISKTMDAEGKKYSIVYFHGGWGKISAAASTQYAIDRWTPRGSSPRSIVSGRALCYKKGSREVLGRVFPRIKEIGGRER